MANAKAIHRKTLSKVSKENSKYIIHSDIDKNLEIDKNDIKLRTNYDDIVQSLWTIISTEKGEVPHLMAFGTDLKKYVFEQSSNNTINTIKDEFIGQIQQWETRINIIDVKINVFDELGIIKIDLLFNIAGEAFRETFTVGENSFATEKPKILRNA